VSTILLDEHLDGFLRYLESLIFNDAWREIARAIELRFVRLRDVGIAAGTSDLEIWRFCQTNGLYLLTDNRAETTADSLGAVIAADNTPASLPVFTISDMDSFRNERGYAEKLAESLIDFLLTPENVRGAGRVSSVSVRARPIGHRSAEPKSGASFSIPAAGAELLISALRPPSSLVERNAAEPLLLSWV
jgi:hypothetical protein